MSNNRLIISTFFLLVCSALSMRAALSFLPEVPDYYPGMNKAQVCQALDSLLDKHSFGDVIDYLESRNKGILSPVEVNFWFAKVWLREEQYDEQKRIDELSKDGGCTFSSCSSCPDASTMPPKLAKALNCINQAIKQDPKKAEFYILRSKIYEQHHMNEASIVDANRATTLEPKNAVAYLRRAAVWYYQGRGMQLARFASCPDPAFKKKLLAISKLDFNTTQLVSTMKEALSDANKAIELDPKDAELYCFRCKVREALHGPVRNQLADVTKAISLDSKSAYYYHYRAFLWLGSAVRDLNKALADSNKSVELEPDNTGYRSLRAAILLDLKKYDEWEADYAVLERVCSGEYCRTQKGDGKYTMGKIEEALKVWDQNKNCHDMLKAAYACLQLGDANRAITYCDRALAVEHPDAMRAHFMKATALNSLGNLPSALHEGEVALALAKKARESEFEYGPSFILPVSITRIEAFCKDLRKEGIKAPPFAHVDIKTESKN